ncbi:MAG TPA: hypothetical protein VLF63_01635 [Patescibacteria group bacterium]|nr:hypothetical protein [Patescibacteria group bacterium]
MWLLSREPWNNPTVISPDLTRPASLIVSPSELINKGATTPISWLLVNKPLNSSAHLLEFGIIAELNMTNKSESVWLIA